MTHARSTLLALLGVLALALGACAGSDAASTDDPTTDATSEEEEEAAADEAAADEATADADPSQVAVTTAVLGDIATRVLDGTGAEVEVVMPSGVDPHAYQASASDGVTLREADLVIANGLDLEEGLLDILAAAEEDGVTVLEVADQVDPLPAGEGGHDHGEDEDHGDEKDHDGEDHDHAGDEMGHAEDEDHDHDEEDANARVVTASLDDDHTDDHDHDHGGLDPHVWLDPARVGEIAGLIAGAYAEVDPDAAETVQANAAAYADAMTALDDELQALVGTLGEDQRRLVTNHEALTYLAARYDLEIVDTVLPGTTTEVDVTAAGFAELVTTIEEAGVPALFADTSSSDRLAQALASEVGDVEVVELFTESLGEPGSGADSVEGMIRTNIERIVEALG